MDFSSTLFQWLLLSSFLPSTFVSGLATFSFGNATRATTNNGSITKSSVQSKTESGIVIPASCTILDSGELCGSLLNGFPTATTVGTAAYDCSSSWSSWSSASTSFLNHHGIVTTTTTVLKYTSRPPLPLGNATSPSPYAICDGIPRVHDETPAISSTSSDSQSAQDQSVAQSPAATYLSTVPIPTTITPTNFSIPTPTCSISRDDCDILFEQYQNDHSIIRFGNLPILERYWPYKGAPVDYPHCNGTYDQGESDAGCYLEAENAKFF